MPKSVVRSHSLVLLSVVLLISAVGFAQITGGGPAPLDPQPGKPDLSKVGIDQNLDAQVPLNLSFHDELGKTVVLGDYFHGKPLILSLVYFHCPLLCPEVLRGMTAALPLVKFGMGKDYNVLTVSFDPKDTPQDALQEKNEQLHNLAPASQQSWHFLTGEQASITALTQAVGFHYKYDPASKQFYHATAIIVLTPEGKVSKYFYGVEYNPTDLRLGLVQASNHKIGTVVDAVLLLCCQYNPNTGKYDFFVSRLLAIAGFVTILVLGGILLFLFRSGRGGGDAHSSGAAA
ncbi:MAG: SCO family protein [Terriglobales bacterium]